MNSLTGGLLWDSGRRHATINAPRAQGAAAARVVALDEHGYRTAKKVGVKGGAEALSVTLSPDSVCFVVERERHR